jgi:hypothetical protein
MIRKHYEELIVKYRFDLSSDHSPITEHIISELSSIFELPYGEIIKRLMFFGYDEIKRIHNYGDVPISYTFHIPLADAVKEYHTNRGFRNIADSGLFSFVGGHFVIDGDQYVDRVAKPPILTEYAKTNPDLCALRFGRLESTDDTAESQQARIYDVLHLFDESAQNNEIFDKAKALAAVKKAAHKYHEERNEVRVSFYKLFNIIYEQKKWNSSIFKERTLLDGKIHSLLKNREDYKPSKRTILAIAVGAGLDIKTTEELLHSAGYMFDGSLTDDTYRFVLTEFEGCSIDEVNDALAACNVPLLGTLQR